MRIGAHIENIVKEAYHHGKWGTGNNGSTKPGDVIDEYTAEIMYLIHANLRDELSKLSRLCETVTDIELDNQGISKVLYLPQAEILEAIKEIKL